MLRACGVLALWPAAAAAICERVSPRRTTWVDPSPSGAALVRAPDEGGAAAADGGGALGVLAWAVAEAGAFAAAGAAGGLGAPSAARAIAPSRVPLPVLGALTGALAAED